MKFKILAYPRLEQFRSIDEYAKLSLPKQIEIQDKLDRSFLFKAYKSRDSYYLQIADNTYFGIRLNFTETDEALILDGIYLQDDRINLQNNGLGKNIISYLVKKASRLDKLFYIRSTANYLLLKMINSNYPLARYQVYSNNGQKKFIAEGYFQKFRWLQAARDIKVVSDGGVSLFRANGQNQFCCQNEQTSHQLFLDESGRLKLFIYQEQSYQEVFIQRVVLENISVNILIDPKYNRKSRQ